MPSANYAMFLGTGKTQIGTPVNIGNNVQNVVTAQTVTTTAAIPAGALVVVFITTNKSSTINVTSVTDGTNTYTLARSSTWDANTFVVNEIWYKENAAAVSSGATITANLSATSGNSVMTHAVYVTGINTSSLDKVNSASTGASAITNLASGTTGVLSQSNEICFGLVGGYPTVASLATWTESTGFTTLLNHNDGSRSFSHSGYLITSATTAQNYQPTASLVYSGCNVIATFKGF